jgi:preprotein translocase subunit SecG
VKILTRTLIILAAAAVVIGAVYGLSTTTWGANLLGGTQGESHGQSESLTEAEGAELGAFQEGNYGDESSRQGQSFNLRETLGHLFVIWIITAIVIAITWIGDRLKAHFRQPPAPDAVS